MRGLSAEISLREGDIAKGSRSLNQQLGRYYPNCWLIPTMLSAFHSGKVLGNGRKMAEIRCLNPFDILPSPPLKRGSATPRLIGNVAN
jgi:hypothetical protein